MLHKCFGLLEGGGQGWAGSAMAFWRRGQVTPRRGLWSRAEEMCGDEYDLEFEGVAGTGQGPCCQNMPGIEVGETSEQSRFLTGLGL